MDEYARGPRARSIATSYEKTTTLLLPGVYSSPD